VRVRVSRIFLRVHVLSLVLVKTSGDECYLSWTNLMAKHICKKNPRMTPSDQGPMPPLSCNNNDNIHMLLGDSWFKLCRYGVSRYEVNMECLVMKSAL